MFLVQVFKSFHNFVGVKATFGGVARPLKEANLKLFLILRISGNDLDPIRF